MLFRSPRQFKPGKAEFGMGANIWISASGQSVPQWQPDADTVRFLPQDVTRHAGAQVNHYMIRSDESFRLKEGTLAPVSLTPRYDAAYYRRAMRADVRDPSALRYEAAFGAVWDKAMALPGVRRLHHLCCADHLTAIALKAGRDPAADPRIAAQLALAQDAI